VTYYLVIPANKEAELRNIYRAQDIRSADNPDTAEEIGVMVVEATATDGGQGRLLTGSSRATASDASALMAANSPWLLMPTTWPEDWVYWPTGVPYPTE
jgi:hypothetical protein